MHILLIEDDDRASKYLVKGLSESRHVVDLAIDGETGLHLAICGKYDVIITDLMLPKRDGLSIIRMLRTDQNMTPILILSALDKINNRIDGLHAGADDYLVKPFAFSELLARLEVLSRRHFPLIQGSQAIRFADLIMNLDKQTVARSHKRIQLQSLEFRLLEYLMRHTEQVVTRNMLLENIWDFNFDPQTNVIDVHICRLRRKIDKNFDKPLLHTIRGAGYKLSETP